MSLNRVYITGSSLISAAGSEVKNHWQSLSEGHTHLKMTENGPIGFLHPHVQTELEQLKAEKNFANCDENTLLAILASRKTGVKENQSKFSEALVAVGTSRGPLETLSSELLADQNTQQTLSRKKVPQSIHGVTSGAVASDIGSHGANVTISTSCTSGAHAMGMGWNYLRSGMTDTALVGGVESIHPFLVKQFHALGLYLPESNDEYPYQPLNFDQPGTAFGSGAAMVSLETNPSKPPLGELLACAAYTEQATPTGLSKNGVGLQKAIKKCTELAGISPKAIDLVIGHGSGTANGDAAELKAYEEFFNHQLPRLSFNKWMCGHLIGGSGPLSAVLALEHIRHGQVPGHPYMDAYKKLGQSFEKPIKTVLVNVLGFGGSNCAVLIGTSL